MQIFLPLFVLIGIDIVLVGLLALALLPLAIWRKAAFAVLKRNFISYFSNPTGYVFLCVFVLLTSFAAFWPNEFFANNMATLDQLNRYLPYIMLVFVPAITMSVWAEERRQGTDELLLTLPATDTDIVLGKYLAAAAIYTASLLFSQLSNFSVLNALAWGDVDLGLYFSTYFGYWCLGLAMLAIGMVASFLTSNLTVGFVLGAMFNMPLVFLASADTIVASNQAAHMLRQWSMSAHLEDFIRGVVSMSSLVYFFMVIVLGVYLSIVLIGRRHWSGGKDGRSILGHYLFRIVCLVVMASSLCFFFGNHDPVRSDISSGQISSLSPQTIKLLRGLKNEQPIIIEAYISKQVPETFVKTKLELLSRLKEFASIAGDKLAVRVYDDLEPFSDEARKAEENYGIPALRVQLQSRGSTRDEQVIMGAVFRSGLRKVVVPFFHSGVPVEYELIRSIMTASETKRKKIGVIQTDALMTGGVRYEGVPTSGQIGISAQGPQQGMNYVPVVRTQVQGIVIELLKQYDVEPVDLSLPLKLDAFDALLAVQPSTLPKPQMDRLVEAIEAGVPTAIFEDPYPTFFKARSRGQQQEPFFFVAPTSQPRPRLYYQVPRHQQDNALAALNPYAPLPLKADPKVLLDALGITLSRIPSRAFQEQWEANNKLGPPPPPATPYGAVVWQDYNPHPDFRHRDITPDWVFVSPSAPEADEAFNPRDEIVSGLHEMLLIYPGAIQQITDRKGPKLKFTPLVTTGKATGTLSVEDLEITADAPMLRDPWRERAMSGEGQLEGARFVLAARITGETPAPATGKPLQVVFVADIDMLSQFFLEVRARPEEMVNWRLDNVTFVLNTIDSLAKDDRFIEIRKHQPWHGRLKSVEQRSLAAAEDALFARRQKFREYSLELEAYGKQLRSKADALRKNYAALEQAGKGNSKEAQELVDVINYELRFADTQIAKTKQRLERDQQAELAKIERTREQDILSLQNEYKWWAVILPPLPPLLVAMVVFLKRRIREREGVVKSRLR